MKGVNFILKIVIKQFIKQKSASKIDSLFLIIIIGINYNISSWVILDE